MDIKLSFRWEMLLLKNVDSNTENSYCSEEFFYCSIYSSEMTVYLPFQRKRL